MSDMLPNPSELPRGLIFYWGKRPRTLYDLYRRTAKKLGEQSLEVLIGNESDEGIERRATAPSVTLSSVTNNGPFPPPPGSPPGSPSKSRRKSRKTGELSNQQITQTTAEGYREHDSDPDAIEVILDDPKTRNKVPIPTTLAQRMEVDKFVMPDPSENVVPMNRDLNPHLQTSHDEKYRPNPMPDFNALAFTMATFPRPVVPKATLLANLNKIQTDAIQAKPDDFVAILPTGSGALFFRENPAIARDLMEFLSTLGVAAGDVEVVTPSAAVKQRDDFGPPYVLILTGASFELRSLLLYIQTFAISPALSFHALPFDAPPSWFIMNISCETDLIQDTDASKLRVLAAVKSKNWGEPPWGRLVSQAWAESHPNTSKSPAECKHLATLSLEVTYVDAVTLEGRKSPYFRLTGQPISDQPQIHRQWLTLMRGVTYFVGIQQLKVFKRDDDCRWCKSDDHPSWDCPYPRVEGWFGRKIPMTQRADVAFRAALHKANSQKGQPSQDGRTEDNRRGRGRGRGGPPRRRGGEFGV